MIMLQYTYSKGCGYLKTNVIFAFCILGIAFLLVLHALNVLAYLNIFTLFLTAILILVIIRSIKHLNFFGIFIPVTFLILIYGRFFNVFIHNSNLLLLASFIIALGFVLLTREHTDTSHYYFLGQRDNTKKDFKDHELDIYSSFGLTNKKINSNVVESIFLSNVAGLTILDFSSFTKDKTIDVTLQNKFGHIQLLVDKDIQVDLKDNDIIGVSFENDNVQSNKKLSVNADNIIGNITLVRR